MTDGVQAGRSDEAIHEARRQRAQRLHATSTGLALAVADDLRETLSELAAARADNEAARKEHRDLTSRLGFGDGVTEPQADNDTIVRWFDQRSAEADEWVEHQRWRDACYEAGHSDMEDCYEHDPSLRLEAAEAALADARRALDTLTAAARKAVNQWAQRCVYDEWDLIWRELDSAIDAAASPSSPGTENKG